MQSKQNNLKFINMIKGLLIVFLVFTNMLFAQVNVDRIIAIVGNNIILKSDLEQQILQYQSQGLEVDTAMSIQVFEDLLFHL